MKILFIGGTGNISASVSRLSAAAGMDLTLLNRGRTGVEIPDVETIVCDINDRRQAEAALAGRTWDAVVNWIAFTPDQVRRDWELLRKKTGQYLFISSASAYQKPPAHPVITESTPLKNPYWQYSRDKIACEELLTQLYRNDDFPITIVRPSLTYDTVIPLTMGAWREYTIVDRMRRGRPVIVHGDGTSLWTVTHAEDFAVGLLGLLGHPQAIGRAFHITSDESLTWDQIFQTVARAAGVEAKIVHIPTEFICQTDDTFTGPLLGDKAHSVIFDNSKIKRFVPDFQAVIPFHIGIRRTLEWFEADPARQIVREESNAKIDRLLEAYRRAVGA